MFDFNLIEDSELKGRAIAHDFGVRGEDGHGYYHFQLFTTDVSSLGECTLVTGPAFYQSTNVFGNPCALDQSVVRCDSYILYQGELV